MVDTEDTAAAEEGMTERMMVQGHHEDQCGYHEGGHCSDGWSESETYCQNAWRRRETDHPKGAEEQRGMPHESLDSPSWRDQITPR